MFTPRFKRILSPSLFAFALHSSTPSIRPEQREEEEEKKKRRRRKRRQRKNKQKINKNERAKIYDANIVRRPTKIVETTIKCMHAGRQDTGWMMRAPAMKMNSMQSEFTMRTDPKQNRRRIQEKQEQCVELDIGEETIEFIFICIYAVYDVVCSPL